MLYFKCTCVQWSWIRRGDTRDLIYSVRWTGTFCITFKSAPLRGVNKRFWAQAQRQAHVIRHQLKFAKTVEIQQNPISNKIKRCAIICSTNLFLWTYQIIWIQTICMGLKIVSTSSLKIDEIDKSISWFRPRSFKNEISDISPGQKCVIHTEMSDSRISHTWNGARRSS